MSHPFPRQAELSLAGRRWKVDLAGRLGWLLRDRLHHQIGPGPVRRYRLADRLGHDHYRPFRCHHHLARRCFALEPVRVGRLDPGHLWDRFVVFDGEGWSPLGWVLMFPPADWPSFLHPHLHWAD